MLCRGIASAHLHVVKRIQSGVEIGGSGIVEMVVGGEVASRPHAPLRVVVEVGSGKSVEVPGAGRVVTGGNRGAKICRVCNLELGYQPAMIHLVKQNNRVTVIFDTAPVRGQISKDLVEGKRTQ